MKIISVIKTIYQHKKGGVFFNFMLSMIYADFNKFPISKAYSWLSLYIRNGDIQDPLLQYNKRVQKYFTHTVFTIVSFKIK